MAEKVKQKKSPRQTAKEKYQDERLKVEEQCNEELLKMPGLMDMLVQEIVKQLRQIADDFVLEYADEIQLIKYVYNKGFRLFNKIDEEDNLENEIIDASLNKSEQEKRKKERKEKRKQQFKEYLDSIGKYAKEFILSILSIQAIQSLIELFSSLYTMGKDAIESIIKLFKKIKENSNEDETSDSSLNNKEEGFPLWKTIKDVISSILPSLDKLLLMLGIYLLNLNKFKDKGDDHIENEISENNLNVDNMDTSINDNNIINDSSVLDPSIYSICPIFETSDLMDNLLNNNGTPNKAIIEINKKNSYSFNVSINDDVSTNNILGYINNVPINSHISGKVYSIDDNSIEVHDYIEYNVGLDKADTIIDNFKSLNYIEDFIRDNIIDSLLPNITINKLPKKINEFWELKNNYLNLNTTIYNKLLKRKDDLINDYYNEIKNINNEGTIRLYCENDNTDKYLNNVLNIKSKFYKNIIQLFNSDYEYSRTVKNNSDYKIYTEYLDIFSNLDNSDNTYQQKYKEFLNNILLERFKIEEININDIKIKINKICVDCFNKNNQNFDYYTTIDNKFKNSKFDYQSVYDYLNSLNKDNKNDISKNINIITNLFIYVKNLYINNLVGNSNNKTIKYTEDDIINLTKSEASQFKKYFSDIIIEYYKLYDICFNDIEKLKEVQWPAGSIIYKNNEPYMYYKFNNINNDLEVTYDNANEDFSGTTNIEVSNIKYWKKYCNLATLLSIPYLSTGLVLMGAPIPLPIIYIPIVVINTKSLTMVIGLGICGIAIYPMTLFVNTSSEYATIIISMMMILDALKQSFEDQLNDENESLIVIANQLIKELENENIDLEKQILEISKQIDDIKNSEKPDFGLLKNNIKRASNKTIESSGIRLKKKKTTDGSTNK